jgi:hypothetical protein
MTVAVVIVAVNLMTRFIFQCNAIITVNTPGARRYTVLEHVNNNKNLTAHGLIIIIIIVVIKYWATIMYYVRTTSDDHR